MKRILNVPVTGNSSGINSNRRSFNTQILLERTNLWSFLCVDFHRYHHSNEILITATETTYLHGFKLSVKWDAINPGRHDVTIWYNGHILLPSQIGLPDLDRHYHVSYGIKDHHTYQSVGCFRVMGSKEVQSIHGALREIALTGQIPTLQFYKQELVLTKEDWERVTKKLGINLIW